MTRNGHNTKLNLQRCNDLVGGELFFLDHRVCSSGAGVTASFIFNASCSPLSVEVLL